jgi:DNA primase
MIPESFVQDLLARVDIVDLIERYVPLKKGGANYLACCPFHNEKSPSFTVSPTKQFYHCFGCGAHGTAIGFLMEHAGMSFPDAVRELASQAGLQVPDDGAPREDRSSSQSLVDAMVVATRFYRDQLKRAPQAIDYLKQRGLTGEIAARFGLGYSPDDWQGLRPAFGKQYEDPKLAESGLVIVNDAGRRYDRFRDRVMFPILDQRGQIIGFGGRVIGKGEPKYLNSPETPLFEKGRELYGLFQARQAIRESGVVVVVEGYMDVVALAQYGFASAVATLGTATTATHIQKLFRHADRVVFCFDGDAAGRKAARRALETCLDQLADNREVRFLFLPAEHDPDSYIREQGLEAFKHAVNDAMPLSECLLRELRTDLNLTTAEDRAKLVHAAKSLVPKISAPVLQLQTIRLIAQDANMSEEEVMLALGLKPSRPGKKAPRARPRSTVPGPLRQLLRLLGSHPDQADNLPRDILSLAGECAEKDVLHALMDAHDDGTLSTSTFAALYENRDDPHIREVLTDLMQAPDEIQVEESAATPTLNGLVTRMRLAALDEEFNSLHRRIAQGDAMSSEDMRRYASLPAQKQKLKSGQPV